MAKPNETTELKCVVIGKPMPTVTWYRDNKKIFPDEKYIMTFDENTGLTVLTIVNTTTFDECMYSVEAVNNFGKAKCQANIVLSTYHFYYFHFYL